ncbi:MAG: gamma-glutamylcyclotransferase [Ramlibacter sp.]|nr:gamma-glutamylcyclotransferase [Ramlibacter sp.]
MPERVFVFGTLKEGFPNFATNKGARVPGDFITVERFPLYLVGERFSPWLIAAPGTGHQVAGQVFEVDPAALARMDALERIHEADGYRRIPVDVVARATPAGPRLSVFAYVKPSDQLAMSEVRLGPLAEYTAEHAALYTKRALT